MFKNIMNYFRRRPQSTAFLIRLIFYIVAALQARTALDPETIITLLGGIIGADLVATKAGESKTTPVSSPRLGAGREMPPELRTAALAVQAFLPGPISELWNKYGESMWGLIETARMRALTPEEGVQRVKDEVARRG